MAIKISSNIDTKSAADKYATHLGNLTKGGIHTKDSIAQMNSISTERRVRMMLCVVADIGNGSPALYWLNTPPNPTLTQLADNQYWQLVPLGSTVEGVLSLQGFQDAGGLTILDSAGNTGDTFIVESGGAVNDPLIFGGQAVTLTVGDYLVYENNKWNLIPTGASSLTWGTLPGKPTAFNPTAHTHVVADITDFPDLSGYLTSVNISSEILEATNPVLLANIGAIKNYIDSLDLLILGELSTQAYRGDRGKIAYDHSQLTSGNPHAVTKTEVGLSNVDNTSDVLKPVSNAVNNLVGLLANLTTTDKTNIVAAINEINGAIAGLGNLSDTDIDTLAELNAILTDAAILTQAQIQTLIDATFGNGFTKVGSKFDLGNKYLSKDVFFGGDYVYDINLGDYVEGSPLGLLNIYTDGGVNIRVRDGSYNSIIDDNTKFRSSSFGVEIESVPNAYYIGQINIATTRVLEYQPRVSFQLGEDDAVGNAPNTLRGQWRYKTLRTLTHAQDIAHKGYVDTKQDSLISGTNIKTINGNSILGSGNITISGGTGGGIGETYATIAALLAAQGSQVNKTVYEVTDASTDATVDSGIAWYKYKGVANGALTDYTKVSEEESFSENTAPTLQQVLDTGNVATASKFEVNISGNTGSNYHQLKAESGTTGVDRYQSYLYVENDGVTLQALKDIGAGIQNLGISVRAGFQGQDKILVFDNLNNKGFEYNGDYSAVGTLDDRWIPDYGAVKALIELLASTGTSVAFDRPRSYGIQSAAETGNITFDFTNAIDGMTQVLRHNSGTKPTMPASANKLSGDYVVSVDNQIYMTAIKTSATPTWRVDVTVSQDNTW